MERLWLGEVVASAATSATCPAVLRGGGRRQEATAQLPAGSAIMYHRSVAEVKSNGQAAGHWQVADVMRQRVDGRRLHEMPTNEHQPCIDKNDVIEAA